MKKQVMKRAHELAKGFEGHYAARLALALRQAWTEVKAPTKIKVTITQKGSDKVWVAAVTGTHPTYKWNRLFVSRTERRWMGGSTWENDYVLDNDGSVYQICESDYEPYFAIIENGALKIIGTAKAKAIIGVA